MKWNDHSKFAGTHAFLSPSQSSWLRKSEEELVEAKRNSYAKQIGTLVHAYAADCIKLREPVKKSDAHGLKIYLLMNGIPEFALDVPTFYPTFMSYVNDAIGFRLDPEVTLWHSDQCYGTADAINVDRNVLRIHDLKTGKTEAKMDQLLVYASLFYLEYAFKPEQTPAHLRIYQMGEVVTYEPEPGDIREVMDAIVAKDRVVQSMQQEVL